MVASEAPVQADKSGDPSDPELLRLFVETGDRTALGEIFSRHAAAAFRIARAYLKNSADAEDAVQNGFVAMMQNAASYRGSGSVKSWAIGFVVNACQHKSRELARRKSREEAGSEIRKTSMSQATTRDPLTQSVADAVEKLSDHYRIPILLHYYEGLTSAEVAATLKIPENTIRSQLLRGVEQLRQSLGASHASVSAAVITTALASMPADTAPSSLTLALSRIAGGQALAVPAAAKAGLATKVLGVKLAAALVFASAAALIAWQSSNGARQRKAADTPVEIRDDTAPAPATKALDTNLTRILATKLDVAYRRDFLNEVLIDLNRRAGLKSGYPAAADRTHAITMESTAVSVEEILKKLSSECGLRMEYQGDTVLFWKNADEKQLARLLEAIGNADVVARRQAVYELAQLGDPRIYAALVKALDDSDDYAAAIALRELHDQHLTVLPFEKNAGVTAPLALKLFASPRFEALNRADLIDLIGATRDESTIDELCRQLLAGEYYPAKSAAAALAGLESPRVPERLMALPAQVKEDGQTSYAVVEAIGTRSDPISKKLLSELLKGPARQPALRMLAQRHNPEATGQLIAMLKDPETSDRYLVADALGETADAVAVDPLIAVLHDKDTEVRRSAISALGRLRQKRGLDAVVELLTDPDADIRLHAATALAEIRDARAFDVLAGLLKDPDMQRWTTALQYLGYLRDPRVVDTVLPLLHDKDNFLPVVAAETLATTRDTRVVDMLETLFETPDVRIQTSLAALGATADETIIDKLIALTASPNVNARVGAIFALGHCNSPKAMDVLLAKSSDSNPRIRAAVLHAQMRSPRAVTVAIAATHDKDGDVRVAAVCSLGGCLDPAAADALLALVNDRYPNVAFYLSGTLAGLKDPRAVDAILKLTHYPEPVNRSLAVDALAGKKSPAVTARLFELLEDTDANVQNSAASILGADVDPQTFEKLVALLKDTHSKARYAAFKAVWVRHKDLVAEKIPALLKDPDPMMRMAVAESIWLDDPQGTQTLIALLKETDARIRKRAASTLISLSPSPPEIAAALAEYRKAEAGPKPVPEKPVKPPQPPASDF
jgi:RNA polymerase sigma factor (sigma-70 family)